MSNRQSQRYRHKKTQTNFFFNDIINIKNFHPDKMKMKLKIKSHFRIFLFTILDVWQSKIQKMWKSIV